mmetsp:Transcript_44765/g.108139  ORF Transcript_44765/g.108139 Transcript_44765/m.108139 type:complete len:365 (-) Transcript_44765:162-1256(-)
MKRTTGPAHRTDDGDDSPDDVNSFEESKDSHNQVNSPIHTSETTTEYSAIEEQGDIEASGEMERSLDGWVEKTLERDTRVLISEKDDAVDSMKDDTDDDMERELTNLSFVEEIIQTELTQVDSGEGTYEASGEIERSLDGGVEKRPERDTRVLISERDDAVAPSPKKSNSTFNNSCASDDGTNVQENERSRHKKREIVFLKVVLGLLLISVLVAGIFLTYFFLQPTTTEQKLKELGYPYRKDMKNGWLFDANIDTARTSYTHYNTAELAKEGLGANEVDCAAKCASDDAFAGAWNTFYQECWCFLDVPNTDYCFERCVIEEGIEFSSIRLQSSFEWCPKSYCETFDAKDYCDFRPMKNVTDCLK